MYQVDGPRPNQLRVTVGVRPLDGHSPYDSGWRAFTGRVFCDLRAYLMGNSGAVKSGI